MLCLYVCSGEDDDGEEVLIESIRRTHPWTSVSPAATATASTATTTSSIPISVPVPAFHSSQQHTSVSENSKPCYVTLEDIVSVGIFYDCSLLAEYFLELGWRPTRLVAVVAVPCQSAGRSGVKCSVHLLDWTWT